MKSKKTAVSKLRELNANILNRVYGQDDVVLRVSNAIERRESNVIPQYGPKDAFLFAGPTGVGKTYLAKTLAQVLFGSSAFERFDCSEFKSIEKYDELFGNRSGDPGRFHQAYLRVRQGIWLFDEIEKAHPEFVHLFLQAISEARLTPSSGDTLDLSKLYIIVTTNLGSAEIVGREHLPFSSLEAHVGNAIESWFKPEIRARFGKPFVFRPLTRQAQREITKSIVQEVIHHNETQGREIKIHPEVIDFLICRSHSRRLGARAFHQVIHELLGNLLKNDLIEGGNAEGTIVMKNGHLVLVK